VAAAEGVIADLPAVLADRAALEELVDRLPADQRREALAAEPARTTLLDPRRPARDLLEHLLDGVSSCHLLYAEYAIAGGHRAVDDDVEPDDEDDDFDSDGRVAEYAERRREIARAFAGLVQAEAVARQRRLT
jgi:hypothetical protein